MFSSCGKGRQQPSPSALLEVLKQRIKDFEEVYIILDALDECDDRTELMEIIRTMVSWSIPGLHILLTSRKEADIENVMYDFLKLEDAVPLRSDEVNNDIRTYVRHTLAFDTSLRKWQKRQEDIELALMEKSDGM